ncbi:DGQHR domain-containing protein [Aliagarivorans taiwanensis]|uniref:DGQHR domain-containing protein n=1 Tax=Aliagarivorans taiwanensis TaxID=561966 RepID=UPI0003F7C3B3|nr:DGQHR domain-containing protein [Aliagarivorans taiwanensis]
MSELATENHIDIPPTDIVAPNGAPLTLVVRPAREGLSESSNCVIREGVMTWGQFTQSFAAEANSDELCPSKKSQRDVDNRRLNKLDEYERRVDTSYPGVVLFVTRVETLERTEFYGETVEAVRIAADAGRLPSDGQGRLVHFGRQLIKRPELADRTIAFKLIETKTASIWEARAMIRQHFTDINVQSSKPNTSISKAFDSANVFNRMVNQLVAGGRLGDGRPYHDLISLNGVRNGVQIWNRAQLGECIKAFLGQSEKEICNTLADDDLYRAALEEVQAFMEAVFRYLPLSHIYAASNKTQAHKEALYTKALFATAIGLVGRCLSNEQLDQSRVDYSKLAELQTLPLTNLAAPDWAEFGICVPGQEGTAKIVKSCHKLIAQVLCSTCGIVIGKFIFK